MASGKHARKVLNPTTKMLNRVPLTGFVLMILALTACESDEAKVQRLNYDVATNCLLAQKYQREYQMVELQVPTPLQDSLRKESLDYSTKCDLATRDLNRFMR